MAFWKPTKTKKKEPRPPDPGKTSLQVNSAFSNHRCK